MWATEEWQSVNPTIVAVPTYPETILDDHGSYTTTEYVELTKRYIDYMSSEYAVDTNRIYGTGQSMGCMTTLILAENRIGIFAISTFNTDYILVKEENFERALDVLYKDGYVIV